jgi:hypothetical protein
MFWGDFWGRYRIHFFTKFTKLETTKSSCTNPNFIDRKLKTAAPPSSVFTSKQIEFSDRWAVQCHTHIDWRILGVEFQSVSSSRNTSSFSSPFPSRLRYLALISNHKILHKSMIGNIHFCTNCYRFLRNKKNAIFSFE